VSWRNVKNKIKIKINQRTDFSHPQESHPIASQVNAVRRQSTPVYTFLVLSLSSPGSLNRSSAEAERKEMMLDEHASLT